MNHPNIRSPSYGARRFAKGPIHDSKPRFSGDFSQDLALELLWREVHGSLSGLGPLLWGHGET